MRLLKPYRVSSGTGLDTLFRRLLELKYPHYESTVREHFLADEARL